MRKLIVVGCVAMLFTSSAMAGGYCKPRNPQPNPTIPPVVVFVPTAMEHPTGFCPNGKRAVAGTDGHVPASGNTNDKCDWSAPARVPHPEYPNG